MRRFSIGIPATTALILFSGACLSVGRDPYTRSGSAGLPETGEELYLAACSSCHGAGGAGAAKAAVGFDDGLPDFTDCNFATREPDGDWIAVVHSGGPVRGFARTMPAFGEALTERQLQRVIAHVRTFCPDDRWPSGDLNFPRPLVVEKAFPEDEVIVESSLDLDNDRAVVNQLVYEQRFGPASMFEVVVPFGWIEGTDGWRGGSLGDLAVGVKHTLLKSNRSASIVSAGSEVILPTGDVHTGLGKGTTVFEPFLSVGQGLPASSFVQAQIGGEIPLLREGYEDEMFWRAALGKTVTAGPFGRAWSPIVEILGARALEDGAATHWHVVPQLQVTLNRRQHISANVGVRLPVDGSGDDPQWMFYLLWEWFDGGLTDGW